MSKYKIYPPLGIARVGNAPVDFYIGPESYRGLPIKPNGGDFTDRDFRDAEGRLCRQAARFHIYDEKGHEVTLKTAEVKDIQWTVHMANKKASWYEFKTNEGEHGYASNHPLRNPEIEGASGREKLLALRLRPRVHTQLLALRKLTLNQPSRLFRARRRVT